MLVFDRLDWARLKTLASAKGERSSVRLYVKSTDSLTDGHLWISSTSSVPPPLYSTHTTTTSTGGRSRWSTPAPKLFDGEATSNKRCSSLVHSRRASGILRRPSQLSHPSLWKKSSCCPRRSSRLPKPRSSTSRPKRSDRLHESRGRRSKSRTRPIPDVLTNKVQQPSGPRGPRLCLMSE